MLLSAASGRTSCYRSTQVCLRMCRPCCHQKGRLLSNVSLSCMFLILLFQTDLAFSVPHSHVLPCTPYEKVMPPKPRPSPTGQRYCLPLHLGNSSAETLHFNARTRSMHDFNCRFHPRATTSFIQTVCGTSEPHRQSRQRFLRALTKERSKTKTETEKDP